MSTRIALLFSGQGAQAVGMGRDLADQWTAAADLFLQADTQLGRSLSTLMFEGPAEDLTQTVHCQPALYVHGLAALAALEVELGAPIRPHAVAGLSLGEFTAHAAARTFDFATGLSLVDQRARFMQEACEATDGAMAAMIGGDEQAVRDLAAAVDVDVANLNCPGQIVLSGKSANIAAAIEKAKEYGIRRATLLNVAGAYHSRLMVSAAERLGVALDSATLETPSCTVVCNVEATPVADSSVIGDTLRRQVTGSVRWTETLEYLIDREGITQFIEIGPGGILAGLLNRTRKGTPILSVADADGVRAAAAALHG